MKQTVEEAAREYSDDCDLDLCYDFSRYCYTSEDIEKGFIVGAEWQAKQSPWISVEERLPKEEETVLTVANYEGRYYYDIAFVMGGKWVCNLSEPICWMPIPAFDQILEANKDVLQRMKEKGD